MLQARTYLCHVIQNYLRCTALTNLAVSASKITAVTSLKLSLGKKLRGTTDALVYWNIVYTRKFL